MIRELVALLQRSGVEPTAREVADVLWLAGQTARPAAPQPASGDEEQPEEAGAQPTERRSPPAAPPVAPCGPGTRQEEARAPEHQPTVAVHHAAERPAAAEPSSGPTRAGVSFRSPTAAALAGAREMAKAIRPLRRRVPSRTRLVLDEAATADRMAEALLGGFTSAAVALRPALERWLDIALVVDEAASMSIWQTAVAELKALLSGHGAFRDVRVYRLATEAEADLALFAGALRGARRPCGVREIIDPRGMRLVLVVSDCVADAWDDGRMATLLGLWGQHGPVAVIQLLPERLWLRTGLGSAVRVRLRSPGRGAPNARLMAERISRGLRPAPLVGVPLPVAALDPEPLASLARVIAGAGGARARGVVLRTGATPGASPGARGRAEALTPRERVEQFRERATPPARRLAALLAAAAPLSLPVMRLVRETMVPEATHGHLAEVFLGGLLYERIEGGVPADPEAALYEFYGGTREILIGSAGVSEATEVLQRVSEYVSRRLGQLRDFRALLAGIDAGEGTPIPDGDRPFAAIRAMMLRQLGGEHARLAEAIERRLQGQGGTWPGRPRADAATEARALVGVGAASAAADEERDGERSRRSPEELASPEERNNVKGASRLIVAGTASYELPSFLRHTARGLGRAIATRGYGLIGGGMQGVDYVVADEYTEQLALPPKAVAERLLQLVPGDTDADFPGGRVVHVPRRSWLRRYVGEAAGVILVGGVGGTYAVAKEAYAQGKPVVPIPGTGGAAQQVYDEMFARQAGPSDLSRRALRILRNAKRWEVDAGIVSDWAVSLLEEKLPDDTALQLAAYSRAYSRALVMLIAASMRGRNERQEWREGLAPSTDEFLDEIEREAGSDIPISTLAVMDGMKALETVMPSMRHLLLHDFIHMGELCESWPEALAVMDGLTSFLSACGEQGPSVVQAVLRRTDVDRHPMVPSLLAGMEVMLGSRGELERWLMETMGLTTEVLAERRAMAQLVPDAEEFLWSEQPLEELDGSTERLRRRLTESSYPAQLIALYLQSRLAAHRVLGYVAFQVEPSEGSVDQLIDAISMERAEVEERRETRALWQLLTSLERANRAHMLIGLRGRRVIHGLSQLLDLLEKLPEINAARECRTRVNALASDGSLAVARFSIDQLDYFASQYEELREREPAESERTSRMDELVRDVAELSRTQRFTAQEILERFERGTAGHRIVALGQVLGAPDPWTFDMVLGALTEPKTIFEHWTAMNAALALVPQLSGMQLNKLGDTIIDLPATGSLWAGSEWSRLELSVFLLETIERKLRDSGDLLE
ncbi:uncharacterized protein SOCE26_039170 [Sorangium cellulosum]|uniref:Uncharacterized protein n=1 Tax=Sorangium cellulosum TaxID=56 RepID=A0A2L0ET79_SORCE|nr:SAV_2336 N-terminal domain-related protein [Sorangium cellulosum]AUX42484.1 uncharacterized protein SOCE26_039170 [Sorangium cellulosum]